MTAENLEERSSFKDSSLRVAVMFSSSDAKDGFREIVLARRLSRAVRAVFLFSWFMTAERAAEEFSDKEEEVSIVMPAVSRSFFFASGSSESTSWDRRSRDWEGGELR